MATQPIPEAWAEETQLLRILKLSDRDSAPAQNLRDCAVLLRNLGQVEAAERLFDAAELYGGLPPRQPHSFRVEKQPRSSWEVAVNELSDLITLTEAAPAPPDLDEPLRSALADGSPPPGRADGRADANGLPTAATPSGDWLKEQLGPALRGLLSARKEPCAAGAAHQARETSSLIEAAVRWGPIDLQALPDDLAEVAGGLAFNVMRRVLVRRGELARPPFGGPMLFQRAELLTTSGLGLGFANVAVLAPTWPVLKLLIGAAWRGQPRKHALADTVSRFGVLLPIGLPSSAAQALVNGLADSGHVKVLKGFLVRLLREPVDLLDHDLMRAVRDAFLDLGDLRSAIAAQTRLTTAMGHHPAEAAAQRELEASLTSRTPAGALSAGPDPKAQTFGAPRRVLRRSAFHSTAAQRKRRFPYSTQRLEETWNAPER